MTERIHLQEGRLLSVISEIVPVLTFGEIGCGRSLGCEESALSLPFDNLSRKRQNETSEVTSSAKPANHHIRLLVDNVELFHRLHADNRLINQNMIQNTPETISIARVLLSIF